MTTGVTLYTTVQPLISRSSMVKIQCPNCNSIAAASEAAIGRGVRCKNCNHAFQAVAMADTSDAPANPFAFSSQSSSRVVPPPPPPPPSLRQSASLERPAARPAKSGGSGAVWVLGAFIAFLLPVAASAAFAVLNWKRSTPVETPAGRKVVALEVGSSATSMALFEVYPGDGNEPEVRFQLQANASTKLTEGMSKTGEFSPEGVELTVKAVKDWRRQFQEQGLDIAPDNFILVGSGGLMTAIRDRKDLSPQEKSKLVAKNRDLLRTKLKDEAGVEIDFIEPHEEAHFQIHGVIRHRDRDEGIYIDVGGGGTRSGYRNKEGAIRTMVAPGLRAIREAVTLEKKEPEKKDPPPKKGKGKGFPPKVAAPKVVPAAKLAADAVEAKFRPALRDGVKKDPEFSRREQVYLIGGITWVMATTQNPKKVSVAARGSMYVKITSEDIASFRNKVNQPGYYLDSFAIPDELDEESKKDLTEALARMKKIYPTREDLIAGAEILFALSEELELDRKTVWFNRMAHLAWLSRYLQEVPGQ